MVSVDAKHHIYWWATQVVKYMPDLGNQQDNGPCQDQIFW